MLEINKYPNRRFYDTTRSRNISLQQIHKAIMEGSDVRVVDAKTGQDITAQILAQILLEYEPLKLSQFSNELLTQTIRVNDAILKDFIEVYFRQAFEAFCVSQKHVNQLLRHTHQLQSVLPRSGSWAGGFFPPWMSAPAASAASPSTAAVPPLRPGGNEEKESRSVALDREMAALRKEISMLKEQLSTGSRRKRRQQKTK